MFVYSCVHQYIGDSLWRHDRTWPDVDAWLAHKRPWLVIWPGRRRRLPRHVQVLNLPVLKYRLYRGDTVQLCNSIILSSSIHTHPFNGLFSGTTRVSWYQKVSGSGVSWAICKSAPCSSQITTPAPHHSVFYRPDALPAAQPTASYKKNNGGLVFFETRCINIVLT